MAGPSQRCPTTQETLRPLQQITFFCYGLVLHCCLVFSERKTSIPVGGGDKFSIYQMFSGTGGSRSIFLVCKKGRSGQDQQLTSKLEMSPCGRRELSKDFVAPWSYPGSKTQQGRWVGKESGIEDQSVSPGTPHQQDCSTGGAQIHKSSWALWILRMPLAEKFVCDMKGNTFLLVYLTVS